MFFEEQDKEEDRKSLFGVKSWRRELLSLKSLTLPLEVIRLTEVAYGSLEWWQQVVDVDMLQEIIDRFATSLQCGAVLTTTEGEPITKPSNFTSFCLKVRETREGRRRCFQSDAQGGKKGLGVGNFQTYRCHCGLIDTAIPLIIEGRLVGVLLVGQVKVRHYTREEAEELARMRWDFSPDPDDLVERFLKVPVVDEERVSSGGALLRLVASYVVTLCERRLTERSLLQKGIALMKEQMDRESLERNLKQSQARNLHRQLNPHFVFNTLNTISRLAMFEGADQTRQLTVQLAEYLRYVLRKQSQEELVPLAQELECIGHFMEIYKVRFGDRLSFSVEATAEASRVRVPFMVLQPLVENAVVHGIEPSLDPGVLEVSCRIAGGRLVMRVADNGVGCDVDHLQAGLGIANVRERLQLHFGDDVVVAMESAPGRGTTVEVRLPLAEEVPL
ncbi:sensor histidine kinase [Aminirod propionatiphilus]|uniref:sensor histidine kinase n=1 Tax=Aminirod propionatiphilus TaxID=3415223 RepID=UPI003BFA752B